MQQFLKRLIQFACFTVLFYLVSLILWGELIPHKLLYNLNYKKGSIGQMQLRLEELHTLNSVDVLFIGSSTTYRGFDPRIFKKAGIISFNLGSSAQTPIQSYYLIKKYVVNLNTELLIIDINPLMFSIDGVESSLDIISNEVFNKELITMASEVQHIKVYNTLIYAWFLKIINKNSDFSIDTERFDDTYISGGFVEHKHKHFNAKLLPTQEWQFNAKQFSEFEKIIYFLHENELEYLIVQSPMAPSLYSSYSNNSILDQFASKYGTYLNFNNLISLNDSIHFFDAYHLNEIGVKVYNQELINYLISDSINYNF